MSTITVILIICLFILIVLSGFLSGSETALTATSKPRILLKLKKGNKNSKLTLLGKTQALFFGGKTLNSEEMLEWELVHEVVSDEELKQRTMEMAKQIAAGPKTALAETKKLLLESEQLSLDEELKKEREKNKDSGNTGDAVEGIKAFLEKRDPKFE